MSLFTKPSDRQTDIGLTILRVAIGAIFMAHGGQKLFVWGFDGVAGGFAQMGIPMAGVMGPFIGLLEFFGGAALIVGLLTRLASFGLASTMVVAILVAHLKNGFFNPAGIEFPLSLLASTVLLVLTGAGSWSVDGIIAKGRKAPAVQAGRPAVRRAA
jgi:putative oxidoreductase